MKGVSLNVCRSRYRGKLSSVTAAGEGHVSGAQPSKARSKHFIYTSY
jgi:hypothetical protein